ncbi:hypothetical protein ILUMI_10735 [Ignelater luminosus]|uniref:Platelet-derived growth factor (PDGF) family profile domain-containing protein n=1 Tax=Ignelater luminosus TaxID=2038154 RepID=A0A8K0GDW4_IGNLU|nr:hypothetical protein ILUMI_10735 [Ignelater luminosus]
MALKYLPTRFTTNFALCGLVLLIISTCRAVDNSKKILAMKFERHIKLLKQFPCRPPQPRIISVLELIRDQVETYETVQPDVTILHRCDNGTGFCGTPVNECQVQNTTEVKVVFYVRNTVNNTTVYKEFSFQNHTDCSCQPKGNRIK